MSIWAPILGETAIDPSGLKVKGVTNRRELNIVEAKNIRQAITKYLTGRTVGIDYEKSLRIHHDMFGDVWKWAGTIRTCNGNLGLPFEALQENLALLFDDLQSWSGYKMPLLEQAVRLHHRAVQIHPFENGNGRWARLLANIHLRRSSHPLTIWPDTVGEESEIRSTYIEAVKTADRGDYEPLIELHRLYTESS